MQSQIRVRIPQITSIETALRLYYERIELSSSDIKELFGKVSDCTVAKLKNRAREIMREENTPVWNARNVNTEAAYKAWGLEIESLERRFAKIRKMETKACRDGKARENLTEVSE